MTTLGKMRHRMALYTPIRVSDNAGGFTRTDPTEPEYFYGHLKPKGTVEKFKNGTLMEVREFDLTCRRRTDLIHGVKLTYDGRDFYVVHTDNLDVRSRYTTARLREGDAL